MEKQTVLGGCFVAIGKMMESCEKLNSFETIDVDLPLIDSDELSTDQKYLFDICNGIFRGNLLSYLSLGDPRKI